MYAGGPDHIAGARQRVAADQPRDPEVGQLGDLGGCHGALGHEHVGRLDVAVHDALSMCVLERVAERDSDRDDVVVRQLTGRQQMIEGRAAHELGDQVGALVVDRRLVQGHDPRMRQAGRRSGLALEAAAGDPLAGHDLDRDIALQTLVPGHPDGADRLPCRAGGAAGSGRARAVKAGLCGGCAGSRTPAAGRSVPG